MVNNDHVRAFGALVALATAMAGAPAALVTLVGWPLPTSTPTWETLSRAITTGDIDDWTLVKLFAVLGWIAWAIFATSVAAETVALARGRQARRPRATASIQAAVGRLIATAALLFTGMIRPAVAAGQELPTIRNERTEPWEPPEVGRPIRPGPADVSHLQPRRTGDAFDDPATTEAHDDTAVWMVQRGDTLWDIAERTLGDGLRWREIRDANVGRRQPDGGALAAGEDRIKPGWKLALPTDARLADRHAGPSDGDESKWGPGEQVTVRPGDTLWDLADEHLGDPFLWPTLFETNANRPQPDGEALVDPDLIRPGWELLLPTDGHDPESRMPQGPSAELTEDRAPSVQPEREGSQSASPGADREAFRPEAERPGWFRRDPLREPTAGTVDRSPSHEAVEDLERPGLQMERASASDEPTGAPGGDGEAASGRVAETAAAAASGLAAAGIITTLERIRRARRRRRPVGRHLRLPDGPAAEAESRIHGLADFEGVNLLDRALDSLAVTGNSVMPKLVLTSMSQADVAVHLSEPVPTAPSGWRAEDGGRTLVIDRSAVEAQPEAAAGGLWSPHLLVSLGTSRTGGRRVLLNLAHIGMLGIDGDPDTRRNVLLDAATELATAPHAAGLLVVAVGFADSLAALERIETTDDPAGAVSLLEKVPQRVPAPRNSPPEEAVVALFVDPPGDGVEERIAAAVAAGGGAVAAILPCSERTRYVLVTQGDTWKLGPLDLALSPLELDGSEIEQLGETVRATKEGDDRVYVAPSEVDATDDEEATVIDLSDGEGPEVRILGPVEIDAVERFETVKSQELIVYLLMCRSWVDADALMEALWPGETPNRKRLNTELWRARRGLGEDPDGKPYLPYQDHDRYRLDPRVRLDYDSFRTLVRGAHRDGADPVPAYRSALELVRDRPLKSTPREYRWATHDVHAIEQEITDAAKELVELCLERGDLQAAAWAADRGLKADPFFEVLYRDLMRIEAASGNTMGVHAVMLRLKKVVNEETTGNDVDDWIDPETVDLYEQLTLHGSDAQQQLR